MEKKRSSVSIPADLYAWLVAVALKESRTPSNVAQMIIRAAQEKAAQ